MGFIFILLIVFAFYYYNKNNDIAIINNKSQTKTDYRLVLKKYISKNCELTINNDLVVKGKILNCEDTTVEIQSIDNKIHIISYSEITNLSIDA